MWGTATLTPEGQLACFILLLCSLTSSENLVSLQCQICVKPTRNEMEEERGTHGSVHTHTSSEYNLRNFFSLSICRLMSVRQTWVSFFSLLWKFKERDPGLLHTIACSFAPHAHSAQKEVRAEPWAGEWCSRTLCTMLSSGARKLDKMTLTQGCLPVWNPKEADLSCVFPCKICGRKRLDPEHARILILDWDLSFYPYRQLFLSLLYQYDLPPFLRYIFVWSISFFSTIQALFSFPFQLPSVAADKTSYIICKSPFSTLSTVLKVVSVFILKKCCF